MSSLSTGSITTSRRIATPSTRCATSRHAACCCWTTWCRVTNWSAHRDFDKAMRLQRVAGVDRPIWHGDVYRAVCVLLDNHPELCVRTIVGSGNPQALIWSAHPNVTPTPVTPKRLSAYGNVSYETLFADEGPAKFAPGEEEAVLAEGLASVVGR